MQPNQLLKIILFTMVLATFGISGAFAVPNGPVIGKVSLVLGKVTGTDQDGDNFEVKRGADLHAGYTLETAVRSFIRAELNDGTRMTVSQNGSATLDEFSFDESGGTGGFNTTVRRGGFQYVSGKLGSFGGARVHSKISTPSGVIGVRGTTIQAIEGPDGLSISVPNGQIDLIVTRTDGTTYTTSVGVNADTPIAQVSATGEVTVLDTLPPILEAAVQQIVELVQEAEEAAAEESGEAGEEDAEEEEVEEEDAEEEEAEDAVEELDEADEADEAVEEVDEADEVDQADQADQADQVDQVDQVDQPAPDDSVEAPAATIDAGVISVPESTPSGGGSEEIVDPNASASTTE